MRFRRRRAHLHYLRVVVVSDYVTYHGSETLEDTFRRSDGDEFGY